MPDLSKVIKLLSMKNSNIDLYGNVSKAFPQKGNRDTGR